MNTNMRNSRGVASMLKGVTVRRGMAWGIIIVGALLAFEVFNYSTTQFALADVLGNLKFAGIPWATILALAFCGIDFAGIARLFTPEQGRDEPAEVWYLFGAWLLAAGMNATLTWWGVSVAIVNHNSLAGGVVLTNTTLTKVVPVFVAIMVWVIRVLIIGTFSVAGERLFSQADARPSQRSSHTGLQPASSLTSRPRPVGSNAYRPTPAAKSLRPDGSYRQEPTYHNVAMSSKASREAEYVDTPRHS
ncbi:MAG TPA: hypothetical protein VMC09_03505 [Anaerolineales bacterium]|nr:hypothetical protein [Anaerolineales bacterium]